MFDGLLKNIGQSVIQDIATSAGALLIADGLMTNSQETGFVGSIVFLGMLALNAFLQHTQKKAAS